MSEECAETPLRDTVKAVLEFMAQGPRMVLSDAPGESSMMTMSSTGKVSVAVAATIARQQALLDRALESSFDDKARADRAEEEIARLREALKPFAEYLQAHPLDLNNKGRPLPDSEGVGWIYLTIGDFRRARAALTPKP